MSGTRNTRTQTSTNDGRNRTATHVSTNIIIVCAGNVVGAIKKLSIQESRGGIQMIDEVGTDGHIDSVPNKSTDYSGDCDRVRYDRMRIAEAFSRGFTHVKSQRVPFDIEIQDRFHDADKANQIITVIKNVWIKQISYDYSSDDFVVADRMSWVAEDIYSIIKTNQNIVQPGGQNGYTSPIIINPFEQDADRDLQGKFGRAGIAVSVRWWSIIKS